MQQQTNILNSPFPFPRSAMEFFFASEDKMHVVTVSSICLILILLKHRFKYILSQIESLFNIIQLVTVFLLFNTSFQAFYIVPFLCILFTFLFLNIYFSFLYSNTSEDCKLHSFPLSYLTFYVIWLVIVCMSRSLDVCI